jgi:hypothetical protein
MIYESRAAAVAAMRLPVGMGRTPLCVLAVTGLGYALPFRRNQGFYIAQGSVIKAVGFPHPSLEGNSYCVRLVLFYQYLQKTSTDQADEPAYRRLKWKSDV